jgi:hypothetical protein
MAISLRKAYLYREIVLDKKKRPIVNGKRAAFIREQLVDSRGRIVKSRTREFAAERNDAELTAK